MGAAVLPLGAQKNRNDVIGKQATSKRGRQGDCQDEGVALSRSSS